MEYVNYNKSTDHWVVQKWIDGKLVHFGSFKLYEKAVEHKEYCMEHNWNIEKCKINNIGMGGVRMRVAHMFGLEVEDLPSKK